MTSPSRRRGEPGARARGGRAPGRGDPPRRRRRRDRAGARTGGSCSRTTPPSRRSASSRRRAAHRADRHDHGPLRADRRDGRAVSARGAPGPPRARGRGHAETVVRFRVRETGEERWSAVKATPIRDERRQRDDGDQRHRGHHHSQARRAARSASWPGAATCSLPRSTRTSCWSRSPSSRCPELADWCAVDLLTSGRRRAQGARARGSGGAPARDRAERALPAGPGRARRAHQVVRTGQPELYPEIPDEMLRDAAEDEEHYRDIIAIGMRSAIIVPMITRGRTLGALTLVNGRSGRRFDEQDVELAQELARRCATAVDNARLYTRALVHRPDAPAEPAARRAARHPGDRGRPRASARPGRATRSAATSTTCSRPATAAGRS